MRPAVGFSRPEISRRVVVLPAPVGPSSTKNSPLAMSRLMPSSAWCWPKVLETLSRRMRAMSLAKPDTERGARFAVEEMRVRRVDPRPDAIAGLADIAGRRARAQRLVADLEVDDVEAAEGLD